MMRSATLDRESSTADFNAFTMRSSSKCRSERCDFFCDPRWVVNVYIVTRAFDLDEAHILETGRDGASCVEGNRLIEAAMQLEDGDFDVLVSPKEQSNSIDRVLAPDESKQCCSGTLDSECRYGFLAM